ncbi:uncharacterized protein LOC131849678 [Achroia grisella]|uniref:uncharacterized protein LOC131849678 n=1 Tax=Achroia grisella TaxID=688607 RepID=UPI0027D1F02F|nr:uncharacterized protein LOC131849678 [Achroia grisella]
MPTIYHIETSETLLENYLNEEFQAMLKPLNLLQYILLTSKYRIRDNFITPNGSLHKLVATVNYEVALWTTELHRRPESRHGIYIMDNELNDFTRSGQKYTKKLFSIYALILFTAISFLFWILKNTVLHGLLSYQCEKFYMALKDAEILFHTTETFIHNLIYVEFLIVLIKFHKQDNSNYLLQVHVSVESEKLTLAFKSVVAVSASVMQQNTLSEEERRIYKNIHRLSRASCNKMNACGLYDIDATLPLRLLSLLATYTIVLLQFALLNIET